MVVCTACGNMYLKEVAWSREPRLRGQLRPCGERAARLQHRGARLLQPPAPGVDARGHDRCSMLSV